MNAHVSSAHRKNRVEYFFPIQLLLLHLKKNQLLLFVWIFFFGVITGNIGKGIGVPQQFLVPEYLGATGLISFAILGFSIGGFISGYNLYTYIMHGYRFPFIATLSQPFHKFCINNFLLPGLFLVTYIFCSAKFQIEKELIPPFKVVLNLLSFFAALVAFQSLSYLYFLHTNKVADAYGRGRKRSNKEKESAPVDTPIHHPIKWVKERLITKRWHVETYLSSFKKISLARESNHYSKDVLEKVFSQNHINASRFEIALLFSFLLLGSLRSIEVFIIPAAASTMLFFTMMIMVVSALHSWLRGWTVTVFIIFLLLLNSFYSNLKIFRSSTKAYGMNYNGPHPAYNPLQLIPDRQRLNRDETATRTILEKWKIKTGDTNSISKPKLIILNHSGGGSRSALWTMRSLAYADSIAGGEILKNTVMMTGASGGMVGAAYLRELMLQKAWGKDIDLYDPTYAEKISMDLLNPILLSATTNDWFIRFQHLKDGEYSYSKDRSTAWEEQLARNTDKAFNRRLGDYTLPEKEAIIPMMILTPTIVNDGRRLLISSQPVSYLANVFNASGSKNGVPEDIEFSRLFEANDAMNLHFSSALRMNATFPYVIPMTTLPSEPEIEVLDAGIRDNFGLKTSMQFLYTFREWINANTSGVIILQVRDLPKNKDLSERSQTLMNKFSGPIGGIYGNITKTHDYNGEQALKFLQGWFGERIHLVTFELEQDINSHISLSWHLTKSEKRHIANAVNDTYFQAELNRLLGLLER
jgi:hypothetical protein